MPRHSRIVVPEMPFHVTQRAHNGIACFRTTRDRRHYLALLHALATLHRVAVHAYVLMTNHVHLLVTPATESGLARLMQCLSQKHTRRFNAVYRRSGTLWGGRFHSSLIESERYFVECQRYIELNPVRAGLCSAPDRYRWTSFHGNALGQPDPVLTPHPCYLGLGPDAAARQRAYCELFQADPPHGLVEQLRAAERGGFIVGTDEFKAAFAKTVRRPVTASRIMPRQRLRGARSLSPKGGELGACHPTGRGEAFTDQGRVYY